MTGFGSGEHAALPSGKVWVELRALNHRFLEVRVRAAREAAELASYAESCVRERFSRGRIEIVIRCEGLAASRPVLDRERAVAAFEQLRALRDEIAPGEPVPSALLAMVPDLFVFTEVPSEVVKRAFDGALDLAARDLDAMRAREGSALDREMREQLARLVARTNEIEKRAPDALAAAERRLRERIERLVSSTEAAVDAVRLEQEIALLADRSDVAEELARLRSHTEQLGALFDQDAPIGRRIDFLLQEIAREVNTIGSKSGDVAIARAVVELKADVERMREQAQNVE
jgi:uncharacterized protein (TIGR00255 family)